MVCPIVWNMFSLDVPERLALHQCKYVSVEWQSHMVVWEDDEGREVHAFQEGRKQTQQGEAKQVGEESVLPRGKQTKAMRRSKANDGGNGCLTCLFFWRTESRISKRKRNLEWKELKYGATYWKLKNVRLKSLGWNLCSRPIFDCTHRVIARINYQFLSKFRVISKIYTFQHFPDGFHSLTSMANFFLE